MRTVSVWTYKKNQANIDRSTTFREKVGRRIIPEVRKATFLDSWRGISATTSYSEKDRKNVLEQLEKIM